MKKFCPEPRGRHDYNERWICVRCGKKSHAPAQGAIYQRWWGWSHQPERNLSEEWIEERRRQALVLAEAHRRSFHSLALSTQRFKALQHFGLTGLPRNTSMREWNQARFTLRKVRALLKERTKQQSHNAHSL